MTKTVFVTGGSRGIGQAIVRAAAGKYNVAFTYLNSETAARALEEELSSEYGGVAAFKCDVSSKDSVESAVCEALARFKHIDVLVNNAGVSLSKLARDTSVEEWRNVFAVNMDGAFLTAKALEEELVARRGAIVNVSSVWGLTGASMEVAYSASKAALIGFTKALAKELAPMGVRVNAVAPGAIDTDMMKEYSAEDIRRLIEEDIPLGRLGRAEEVASAALFLAENEYITGETLSVDGLFGR